MKLEFRTIQEKITEDLLFKHISQEFIYFYYLKQFPDVNKSFKSPFTDDNNPSFRFRFKGNKLYFKCFSSGKYGDCIELVKLIENLDYFNALNFIYYNICLSKGFSKTQKAVKISNVEKQPHSIEVVTRDFNSFDLQYWQGFHITPEMLVKYNIKACSEVWDNERLWYSDNPSNPCYRYIFNKKYKIYKPLETNKKLKFNSNCNNLENVQGLKHLFPSDTIFLTKAYKDVIVLNEYCNIPSIALHGEGHFPPSKLANWLISNYKNIVIFYDNDLPGIKAAKSLKEFFAIEYSKEVGNITIPEQFKIRAKDPSDFIKEYGINNLQSTVKYLLNETS